MAERHNPHKRVYQVRRAQQLCQLLYDFAADQDLRHDPEAVPALARQLTQQQWADLAKWRLEWKRPPSTETVAMTIEMVDQRASCDRTSLRRNPWQYGIHN